MPVLDQALTVAAQITALLFLAAVSIAIVVAVVLAISVLIKGSRR